MTSNILVLPKLVVNDFANLTHAGLAYFRLYINQQPKHMPPEIIHKYIVGNKKFVVNSS